MFKVISKILATVLIVVGVAAPIGGCWLLYTRKPQVDFYLSHAFGKNTFGQLTDTQRAEALKALDSTLARKAEQLTKASGSSILAPAPDDPSVTPSANQASNTPAKETR